MRKILIVVSILLIISCKSGKQESMTTQPTEAEKFVPLSYTEAYSKAEEILSGMTIDEKIEYIGGHNFFFIKGVEKYNLPRLYLADATQGVHLRKDMDGQLEKSTAFPAPICLTATWNTQLSFDYAQAIGEECRAGDIAVLLGPGMNIYRVSQNGRNFEYFGEDPFLAARFIEQYITGLQGTGTIATLKHFVCNNSDYFRRTSNSIVDERTLHEIYLPAFKAGVDAGAMAVMTSYNQVNGEWAGQSSYVINEVLRKKLGFKWLVMTDWWAIWDPEKAIKSGLDLDMPGHGRANKNDFKDFGNPFLRSNANRLLQEGKVSEDDIHQMAKHIIATSVAMRLDERPVKDTSYLQRFPQHSQVALQTAREGIVLLKNEDVLPLQSAKEQKILLTGEYIDKNAHGGGAADVVGYDVVTLQQALSEEFGSSLVVKEIPSDEEIESADILLLSVGTFDHEGWDSPFDLEEAVNDKIMHYAALNKKVVVIMNSGRGVGMSKWIDKVAAVLYCWYPGQIGNVALAEILSGKTNPSGKLPITIEKRFEDAPGYPYILEDVGFYKGWDNDFKIDLPIKNIEYDEGVLVGYRWYDTKNIAPLFHFGYGLSYTTFEVSDLVVSNGKISLSEPVRVKFKIKNTGSKDGAEVCQVYIHDVDASVERPNKELKGFEKIYIKAGEEREVSVELQSKDFAFYDTVSHSWKVEPGEFIIKVGNASNNLPLHANIIYE